MADAPSTGPMPCAGCSQLTTSLHRRGLRRAWWMERARTLALPLVAVLACGRLCEAQASRAHVVVGALVPASGGILRPVPLVGAQLGLRTPLLGRTNVMAGVAQLRCRTGGCADPTLLSADMGFERLLVRFPLRAGPALFAEGGGGGDGTVARLGGAPGLPPPSSAPVPNSVTAAPAFDLDPGCTSPASSPPVEGCVRTPS